ncbi:RhoGAP domain containing protein [Tritrichomonas foetus]|uniref:RhoGAP domain containing protein n=1 Tax=Tritrichomonas foetus TaxID=1144522 RepID=A0A1J4J8M5_9EUKA|nr:RhoGAP domain containing protein [Tritrichomonas foetus]|eukprot:OHS94035.1 RhoGAP domain containing protein [Tritrichomonas foetus]
MSGGKDELDCFYYVYKHASGKHFYYNPVSETTTWILPKGSIVIDPDSKEVVQQKSASPNWQKGIKMSPERNRTIISVLHPRKVKTSVMAIRNMAKSTLPATKYYIPDSLSDDIAKNKIEPLFNEIFLSNKGRPLNTFVFQDAPIQRSLLPHDKNTEKAAYALFKSILKYTGVRDSKECVGTVNSIIDMIQKGDSGLVDEIFVQLIKQSNECPGKYLKKTLNLILVVVCTYLPSEKIRSVMLSHLARLSKDEKVKELAIWCYIKFQNLINVGISIEKEKITPVYLKSIPDLIKQKNKRFDVSLADIMFYQHDEYPFCPIPYVMHQIAETLIQKDCETHQGIFRLPGDLRKVDKFIDQINQGSLDFLSSEKVDDLASLFKLWVRQLSGSIVNAQLTTELLNIKGADNFLKFVNKLEPLNRNVLMYLVGFLKRLSLSSQITMMDVSNLAMVFGPNIVYSVNSDPIYQTKLSSHSSSFLNALINKWDVSSIYPLQTL